MGAGKAGSAESLWRAALAIAVLAAVLSLAVDVRNTLTSGAVDLRSRVVGTRVWLAGRDPYFHKWQPGMPDTWLDPIDLAPFRASRMGGPPPVLVFHSLAAGVRYFDQRIAWLAIQWLLFLDTLALFAGAAGSGPKARLIWIVGLLLWAPSHCWRLHVERGQIHILWPFLVAVAYLLCRRGTPLGRVLGGFVVGLAAAMRPPIGFLLLPAVIGRERGMLAGGLLGVLVGACLPMANGGPSLWTRYAKAMAVYADYHVGLVADPVSLEEVRRVRDQWPPTIEGESTGLVVRVLSLPCADSSLQGVLRKWFGITLFPRSLALLLALTMLSLGALFRTRAGGASDPTTLFLWGALFALVAEFLLPAQRYSYNNTTWLAPLFLAIVRADLGVLRRTPIHFLPAAGTLAMAVSGWSEPSLLIGEGTVLLYLMLLTWQVSRCPHSPQLG